MVRARLEKKSVAHKDVLAEMATFRKNDLAYRSGKAFSLVYWLGDDHEHFLEKAHNMYMAENGLNPIAFPSLRRLENEVVQMTADMLHGDDLSVGTMTSGGTESLLLAVKTYRDRAKARRPWIRKPEMVVPETIHVAFEKAAHLFGVKMKKIKVGPDFRVRPKDMEKAITRNTVMLAASAPQYPQGMVDPIEEIGLIAQKRGLPFHVDACFGGYVLPFFEELGVDLPLWDFRVSGVTSISADCHKFGYAGKGASTIVYRNMDWMRHQFFVSTDWVGGVYASPAMPGTRPGGPMAAAWATMKSLGREGYLEQARKTLEATERMRMAIADIPGIRVLGTLQSPICAYASDDPDIHIFAVADKLAEKGWGVDRQSEPPSIHLTVTGKHLETLDEYVADLKEAAAEVKANPELKREG
jgi:glutamate/tyrosine decarboxylase-like PLP-dependent enzyme